MNRSKGQRTDYYDAIIIGAGFSGLYMLYRLRNLGLSVRVLEKGSEVGGTWFWSKYPGLRCDCESIHYCYTFSEQLYKEWSWSMRYPEQVEILAYLNFVADQLKLRQDIQLHSEVTNADYNKKSKRWSVLLNDGQKFDSKYLITGTGGLSVSATNIPNIKGLSTFTGKWYHTGAWPMEKVDFKNKRVGVIGTGSSGVQIIPEIAKEAKQLFVFQRTPQYVIPARNHLLNSESIKNIKDHFEDFLKEKESAFSGIPRNRSLKSALEDSPEERNKVYERLWEIGGASRFLVESYNDLLINPLSNQTAAEFVKKKILEIVKDSKVAEKLLPNYYIGAKRIIQGIDYYETYNRANVSLIDIKNNPIVEIVEDGIVTSEGKIELDLLVFATGYDGITGSLFKIDIHGKEGLSLKEKWLDGGAVKTYLGLCAPGFPNMFMITGPQSPSVSINVPSAIEQHVDWITDCIEYMEKNNIALIEANEEAASDWVQHCNEIVEKTLYPKVDSWFTGANIEGKPRSFLLYIGGLPNYRAKCLDVAKKEYEGFTFIREKSFTNHQ